MKKVVSVNFQPTLRVPIPGEFESRRAVLRYERFLKKFFQDSGIEGVTVTLEKDGVAVFQGPKAQLDLIQPAIDRFACETSIRFQRGREPR